MPSTPSTERQCNMVHFCARLLWWPIGVACPRCRKGALLYTAQPRTETRMHARCKKGALLYTVIGALGAPDVQKCTFSALMDF